MPTSEIRPTTVKITWDTDFPSNSDVHYWSVDGTHNNYNWDKIDDYTQTSHTVELKDLKPFTTYNFTVSSKRETDATKITSDEMTFTTTIDSGTTEEIIFSNIKVPTSEIRPSSVKITWNTDQPSNSEVHYWSVDGVHENWNWDELDDYTQTSHSIELKDLKSLTTYNFTVSGQKEAGFPKTTSEEYSFTTTFDSGSSDDNSTDDASDDVSVSEDDDNSSAPDNADTTNQLVLQLQRQITALEKQVIELEKKLTQLDQKFAERYAGTMFLDVENHGRLWYVDPSSKYRFYFENGEAALSIGSKLATGITYEDIQKIPVGVPDKLYNLKDSDGDGLPDRLESALDSDPNKADTDGDGFSDKEELENGYNPVIDEKYNYNQSLIDKLEGKMLLQVSGPNSHGEIWYIKDSKRWYGGTEDSMYEIMKARSLGAKPDDIRKIAVGDVEGVE